MDSWVFRYCFFTTLYCIFSLLFSCIFGQLESSAYLPKKILARFEMLAKGFQQRNKRPFSKIQNNIVYAHFCPEDVMLQNTNQYISICTQAVQQSHNWRKESGDTDLKFTAGALLPVEGKYHICQNFSYLVSSEDNVERIKLPLVMQAVAFERRYERLSRFLPWACSAKKGSSLRMTQRNKFHCQLVPTSVLLLFPTLQYRIQEL